MSILSTFKRNYDRGLIDKKVTEWDSEAVRRLLTQYFEDVEIQWEDSKYRVVDKDTLKYILNNSIVDELEYESNYFDCDNFADLFKSLTAIRYHLNSIGTVINYSGAHAFNVAVTIDGIYIIEPQSMKIWSANESRGQKYLVDGQKIRI